MKWGAQSAIAAGFVLLGACLAGVPLYVSAAGSEAAQLALASTCPADVALHLPMPSDADESALADVLDQLDGVAAPIRTRFATADFTSSTDPDGVQRRLVAIERTGAGDQFEPGFGVLPPGQLVVQQSMADVYGVSVGDEVTLTERRTKRTAAATLSQVVTTIPVQPEPAFWCGQRGLLRPTALGDLRPPVVFASSDILDRLGADVVDVEVRALEVRTLDDARAVRDQFVRAIGLHRSQVVGAGDPDAAGLVGTEGMSTVVSRGEALAGTIGRATAPVRVAGVLASFAVLVAAAMMLARERRRELRLFSLRGVSPLVTARRLALDVSGAVLVGTLLGGGVAVLAVRTLGPTPELEPRVLREAALIALAGAAVGLLVVATVAAVTGDRFVDAAPRRSWVRWVPWELPFVALAVVSAARLQDGGGLRMVGPQSRGGELLAQAFPLLAVGATVAVLARPLRFAVGVLGRRGGSWPAPVRLGWRRALAEPALAVGLVLSVTSAVSCVALSGMLSASAERQLNDKAATFIGSDLAITLTDAVDVPTSLAANSTTVARTEGRLEGDGPDGEPFPAQASDVIGVDRSSFGRGAVWSDRGSGPSIDELLSALDESVAAGSLPAIVVGGDLFGLTQGVGAPLLLDARGTELRLAPVASTTVFPGMRSSTVTFVVDAGALRATGVDVTEVLWLRDPPPTAVRDVVEAGGRTRSVVARADVFDVVSFRAQRWAYDALAAFGVLVGIVVLVLQLLVLEARAPSRRLSEVVLRRTGSNVTARWWASVIESAVPLVGGAAVGAVIARWVAGRSVPLSDPLPTLQPPGLVVVPVGWLVAALVVVAASAVVLGALAAWSTGRGQTMEVVRGTA